MKKRKINIIVAMEQNNGIGLGGNMPWGNEFKEDLAYFKKLTTDNIIVMGRKTYESIGSGPLPNRENIVVSRDWEYLSSIASDVNCCHSLFDAIDMFNDNRDIFIIGGAQIYEQMIDIVDVMYITAIHKSYCHDTKFPDFNEYDFKITGIKYGVNKHFEYDFLKFERI